MPAWSTGMADGLLLALGKQNKLGPCVSILPLTMVSKSDVCRFVLSCEDGWW